MDRALTFIGTIGTALSFLPGLSDPVRWVIFASGMTIGFGGLAHMAWERRLAFAGWLDRRMPGRLVAPPAVETEHEFTSLYEVTRQAYERTRGTFLGNAADRLSNDSPLLWYVHLLDDHFPVFGTHPPSRIMERFDEVGFEYEVVGETIIAVEQFGSRRWESLSLRTSDVPEALKYVRDRAE